MSENDAVFGVDPEPSIVVGNGDVLTKDQQDTKVEDETEYIVAPDRGDYGGTLETVKNYKKRGIVVDSSSDSDSESESDL